MNRVKPSDSIELTHYIDVLIMNFDPQVALDAWKEYLSRQNDSTDIPHLKSKLAYYIKNKWHIRDAWKDFQKVILKNTDEIQWEAGRRGLKITNFKCEHLTFSIFRIMISDMEDGFKIVQGHMEDSLSTVPEIIDVTKDRATDPSLLESIENSFSGLIDESKDPDENSK
jgi:hypothetical protein